MQTRISENTVEKVEPSCKKIFHIYFFFFILYYTLSKISYFTISYKYIEIRDLTVSVILLISWLFNY